MIKHAKLWNGNKALTLCVIVLMVFFAVKFFEARDILEVRHDVKLQAVRDSARVERAAQMDSVWNNQEVIMEKLDRNYAKMDSVMTICNMGAKKCGK